MNNMTVIVTVYVIQYGHGDKALELLTALAKLTRLEPGNSSYIIHRSPRNPRCFFSYESYETRDAFDAHLASTHFQQYTSRLHGICESRDLAEYVLLDEE